MPCYSEISTELSQIEQQHTAMMIPTLLQLNEQLLYTISHIKDDLKSENYWQQFNTVIQKVEIHQAYTKNMKKFFSDEQKDQFSKIEKTLRGLKQFQRLWFKATKARNPEKAKIHSQEAVITILTLPLKIVDKTKVLNEQAMLLIPDQNINKAPSVNQTPSDIENMPYEPSIEDNRNMQYEPAIENDRNNLDLAAQTVTEPQTIKQIQIDRDIRSTTRAVNKRPPQEKITAQENNHLLIIAEKIDPLDGNLSEGIHHLKQYNYESALRYFDNLYEKRRRLSSPENDLLREYLRLIQNILKANKHINMLYIDDSNCKDVSRSVKEYITNHNALKIGETSLLPQKVYTYHIDYLHHINWLNFGDCRRRERKFDDAIDNYKRSIKYISSTKLKDNIQKKIESTKEVEIKFHEAYTLLNKFNYKEASALFKTVDDDFENLTNTLLKLESQRDIDISNEINVLLNNYGHIFEESHARSHRQHLRFIHKLNKAKLFYNSGNTKKATSLLETAEFLAETPFEKEQVQQLLEKFNDSSIKVFEP